MEWIFTPTQPVGGFTAARMLVVRYVTYCILPSHPFGLWADHSKDVGYKVFPGCSFQLHRSITSSAILPLHLHDMSSYTTGCGMFPLHRFCLPRQSSSSFTSNRLTPAMVLTAGYMIGPCFLLCGLYLMWQSVPYLYFWLDKELTPAIVPAVGCITYDFPYAEYAIGGQLCFFRIMSVDRPTPTRLQAVESTVFWVCCDL